MIRYPHPGHLFVCLKASIRPSKDASSVIALVDTFVTEHLNNTCFRYLSEDLHEDQSTVKLTLLVSQI